MRKDLDTKSTNTAGKGEADDTPLQWLHRFNELEGRLYAAPYTLTLNIAKEIGAGKACSNVTGSIACSIGGAETGK